MLFWRWRVHSITEKGRKKNTVQSFSFMGLEWLFYPTIGKKTGVVWVQLTSFVLLLNWPAREISHWNGVTANVCCPDERVARQTYHWPTLTASLKQIPAFVRGKTTQWNNTGNDRERWRNTASYKTSNYQRRNIKHNSIVTMVVWWGVNLFFFILSLVSRTFQSTLEL